MATFALLLLVGLVGFARGAAGEPSPALILAILTHQVVFTHGLLGRASEQYSFQTVFLLVI